VPNAPAAPFVVPGFRGIVRDDADARNVYSEAAGIQRRVPLAVAVPADADDVVPLVRWAAAT
jgi:FAD/FMN-containing dehydrogenase